MGKYWLKFIYNAKMGRYANLCSDITGLGDILLGIFPKIKEKNINNKNDINHNLRMNERLLGLKECLQTKKIISC